MMEARGSTGTETAELRRGMVREQIEARGVEDERVLRAMREVPRHLFVPEAWRWAAHDDRPVPLDENHGQPTPYTDALVAAWLQPDPGRRILVVGTRSGYLEAVLAACGCEVFGLSRDEGLYERARSALRETGYEVSLRFSPESAGSGWPEEAPFDRILLPGAEAQIPVPLQEQLAEDGFLAAPGRGPGDETGEHAPRLYRYRRTDGELHREAREVPKVQFDPDVTDEPLPEEPGESPRPEETREGPKPDQRSGMGNRAE